MSTNVPNLKQIGGGHRKNGQKFVDLMWNDPIEKVIKKGKTKSLVKWKGYPETFNSWVNNTELTTL